MATETLFLDGTFSGIGWTGTGTDIDEGITGADGNEISSDSDGEDDAVTLDFADIVDIVDADTVTRIDLEIRARVTTQGDDENFNGVDLLISSSGLGESLTTSGTLTSSHANYSLNGALWNTDFTVTQLNTLQVVLSPNQSGMPTANVWHIDTAEVVITYDLAPTGEPLSSFYKDTQTSVKSRIR